ILLKENDGNVYNTFYPIEYIYILYWTEEYEELIDFIKQVDFMQPVSNSVRILAQTDNIFSSLLQRTVDNKDMLLIFIDESAVPEMDKEFLVLQLEDILRAGQATGGIDFDSEHSMYINDLSDQFLENYPDSPYETIIRETIRYRFEPSPWAFYWDLAGFGAVIPTNNLSNYLSTGVCMEMAIDTRYKKLVSILGFGFSVHSLKKDMLINSAIWPEESSATLGMAYLNAGYLCLDTKHISLYPYIGIGYSGFSASEVDIEEIPELKKLSLNSWFPQAGIGFDFKFKMNEPYYAVGTGDTSSRISVRYSYRMPNYGRKLETLQAMDGFTHSIIVSWGLGGRSTVRAK
ncbi:MAG: hypothetical protein GX154_03930, partial [Clostridiales bacterium]|nr:hypothetical protein [Clostridiales bacterium]